MNAVLILTTLVFAGGWYENSTVTHTNHWELRTDLPVDDVQNVGELLDSCYEVYRTHLSNLPQIRNEKLEAWVFSNRKDYTENAQSQIRGDSGVVASTSGMFINLGEGKQILAVDASGGWKKFEETAKHEAFHQFQYSRFRSTLPPWLSEGLAEYFSHSAYINGAIIPGQPTEKDIALLKRAIQNNSVTPFIDFMRMNKQEWGQRMKSSSLQYSQAWSMVHFLVHGEEGRHAPEMDHFLKLIQGGMYHEEAFVKAFNTSDLVSFQNMWMEHIDQLKPGAIIPTAQRLGYFAAGILKLRSLGLSTPTSMEELAQQLEKINFGEKVRVGGEDATFDPANQDTYTVPVDSLVTSPPKFNFTLNKHLPLLSTEGLKPKELQIEWGGTATDPAWKITTK
jgi:hypothetical protein